MAIYSITWTQRIFQLRKAIEKMNTGGFSRDSKKDEDHHHHQNQRKPSMAPGHSGPSVNQGNFLHPPTSTGKEIRVPGAKFTSTGETGVSEGETTEDEFDGNADHNGNKGNLSGGTNRLTV